MFVQVLKEKSLSIFDSIFVYTADLFQLLMKHVIEVFIFLVAYYFALLETRKSRYWFFQYVPKNIVKSGNPILQKSCNFFIISCL